MDSKRLSALSATAVALCGLVIATFFAACAGQAPAGAELAGLGAAGGNGAPGAILSDADVVARQGSFSLALVPADVPGGAGRAEYRLQVQPTAEGVAVAIAVSDAQGLKAVLADLRYDATVWHPLSAEATGALGGRAEGQGPRAEGSATPVAAASLPPDADVLTLAVLDEPGVVHLGQVLVRPQEQAGFSGDAVVARVRFAPGRAAGATRRVSKAPAATSGQTQLFWGGGPWTLHWMYTNKGDGDMNGEVNLADIIPVAANYGAEVLWGNPSDGYNSLANTDGDGNGYVTMGDLASIAVSYGVSVSGYAVYRSENEADYPADSNGSAGPGVELVAFVSFGLGSPLGLFLDNEDLSNLRFRFKMTEKPIRYWWVRPVDRLGNEGLASTLADYAQLVPPHCEDDHSWLAWDLAGQKLVWGYNNLGDYNQDSVVNVADALETGRLMGRANHGDYFSIEYVVDGDTNGLVNLGDINRVAWYFSSALTGYNVYASPSQSDYPASFDAPSTIAPLGHVRFEQALGPPASQRRRFVFDGSGVTPGWYCWVRPELDGAEGTPSTLLRLPGS